MSLILDALNRADQERSEENNHINLHASHQPAPPQNSPLRRWIIEGVIVAVAIAAFVYTQWPLFSADQEKTSTSASPVAATPPIQTTAIDPINNTAQQSAVITTPPVVAHDKTLAPATPISPKPAMDEAGKQTISSLYQQQNSQPTNASENINTTKTAAPPTVAPAPKPTATKAVDNTQLILQQIPLLIELSARYQRLVPNIDYSVHMYADDGRGFVTINGAIQKTGAMIDPGLRVIAILPDSVVLEFKGKQFRLPALNSWVNYN